MTWSGGSLRVGLFGGAFDPVHLGHLAVATGALEHLGLAKVVFVPAGRPWMKEGAPLTEGGHRLRMLQLAVADNPCFQVSDMELLREGLTYTVDTLRELRAGPHRDDELFFILGSDAYASFQLWKAPEEVLRLSILAVVARPGVSAVSFDKLEAMLPGGEKRGVEFPAEQWDVSSSEIRSRVQQGLSIQGLVPPSVESYIYESRLYAAEGGRQ